MLYSSWHVVVEMPESCHFQLTELSRKQQQGQLPTPAFRGCSRLPAQPLQLEHHEVVGQKPQPSPGPPLLQTPHAAPWAQWGWRWGAGAAPGGTEQGRTHQNAPVSGEEEGSCKPDAIRAASGGWETANAALLGNCQKIAKPKSRRERARGWVRVHGAG